MKRKIFISVAVIVLLLVGTLPGYTHGGGGAWGDIGIGPVWPPWWGTPCYPCYYSKPPVVIQQQTPVAYEQQAPKGEAQQYYRYYCSESKAYYPDVKKCPGGWMKVEPTPGSPKGKE